MPWPRHVPATASGRSAGRAAFAPRAIGSETDGSVLSPSGACGVVGLKPTMGLVSRSGIVPISAAQDTAGPMACCVADVAALLGVMAGPDPADPATAQQAGQVPDYTPFLDTGALDGARLGIWRHGSAEAPPAAISLPHPSITRPP